MAALAKALECLERNEGELVTVIQYLGSHVLAVFALVVGLMEVSKVNTKILHKDFGRALLGKDVAFSGSLGCRGNPHDGHQLELSK